MSVSEHSVSEEESRGEVGIGRVGELGEEIRERVDVGSVLRRGGREGGSDGGRGRGREKMGGRNESAEEKREGQREWE